MPQSPQDYEMFKDIYAKLNNLNQRVKELEHFQLAVQQLNALEIPEELKEIETLMDKHQLTLPKVEQAPLIQLAPVVKKDAVEEGPAVANGNSQWAYKQAAKYAPEHLETVKKEGTHHAAAALQSKFAPAYVQPPANPYPYPPKPANDYPMPPVATQVKQKKFDEGVVGKYIIGAIASILVFAAAISLVVLFWEQMTDQVRFALILMVGLLLGAWGYLRLESAKKNAITSILIGTGVGLVFISLVAGNIAFNIISQPVTVLLLALWCVLLTLSFKHTQLYFTSVISYIGSVIAIFFMLTQVSDLAGYIMSTLFGLTVFAIFLISTKLWMNDTKQIISGFLTLPVGFALIAFGSELSGWNNTGVFVIRLIVLAALFATTHYIYRAMHMNEKNENSSKKWSEFNLIFEALFAVLALAMTSTFNVLHIAHPELLLLAAFAVFVALTYKKFLVPYIALLFTLSSAYWANSGLLISFGALALITIFLKDMILNKKYWVSLGTTVISWWYMADMVSRESMSSIYMAAGDPSQRFTNQTFDMILALLALFVATWFLYRDRLNNVNFLIHKLFVYLASSAMIYTLILHWSITTNNHGLIIFAVLTLFNIALWINGFFRNWNNEENQLFTLNNLFELDQAGKVFVWLLMIPWLVEIVADEPLNAVLPVLGLFFVLFGSLTLQTVLLVKSSAEKNLGVFQKLWIFIAANVTIVVWLISFLEEVVENNNTVDVVIMVASTISVLLFFASGFFMDWSKNVWLNDCEIISFKFFDRNLVRHQVDAAGVAFCVLLMGYYLWLVAMVPQYVSWHQLVVFMLAAAVALLQSYLLVNHWDKNPLVMTWVGIKYLILTWVLLVSVFNVGFDTVIVSVAGMGVALLSIFVGFKIQVKSLRLYGLVLSIAMTAKVILVDLQGENGVTRILSLLVGALVCFGISALYTKLNKSSLEEAVSVDENNPETVYASILAGDEVNLPDGVTPKQFVDDYRQQLDSSSSDTESDDLS